MLNVFRPVFEVVKEGRILKNIKHLQRQMSGVYISQHVLVFSRESFKFKQRLVEVTTILITLIINIL